MDKISRDAIAAKYRLHPHLRDLYVEGPRDQKFFQHFLGHIGRRQTIVYPIEIVDVEPTSVQEGGGGCSGKLLALSALLDSQAGAPFDAVRCIIDRDFFGVLLPLPTSPHLLLTDFSCLECYGADGQTQRRLWTVYLMKDISDKEIEAVLDCAKSIYLERAAKFSGNCLAPWLDDFTGELEVQGDTIAFDAAAFEIKLRNKSGGTLLPEQMAMHRAALSGTLTGDRRLYINGHDLIKIIGWFGRVKKADNRHLIAEVLQSALFSMIDPESLRALPLFQALEAWAI